MKSRRKSTKLDQAANDSILPKTFQEWFKCRHWQPRSHQIMLLNKSVANNSVLLIAPTGAGKTLAGFLPTLVELESQKKAKIKMAKKSNIHTLYISPLKALAVDIARNLEIPVSEMGLSISIETRTGDTPAHKRQRQKYAPPDILLTTPEQVTLLLASPQADKLFGGLKTIVLDELHSLITSKRGDLLALSLTRLRSFSPAVKTIGLSATVAEPDELRAYLVPQSKNSAKNRRNLSEIIQVQGGAQPHIEILKSKNQLPLASHSARYAFKELYEIIGQHNTSLLFVNTRSQAEALFQELWRINENNFPIALHHGSLDAGQRRKVEAAMTSGGLKAIVCTSSLDLGIDWGDVDLVINIGAPKGASRLTQRIGRANHRMDEPSKAILVPANRFEVLECLAALNASKQGIQDTPPLRTGSLDVLAQHILGVACFAPFHPDTLYNEVITSECYSSLSRKNFDRVIEFVANGGYALQTYDQFARLRKNADSCWRVSHPRVGQQFRLNVGTIIEEPMLKVRLVKSKAQGRKTPILRGGRALGQIEEWFVESLSPGDTFIFGGEIVALEMIKENEVYVSRSYADSPKIPSYQGGRFPLSTYLAESVRKMLSSPTDWESLPSDVQEWLQIQQTQSQLPNQSNLLVETFPRAKRHYLVCYPFEGRLAHQTLGMLLTRRLERLKVKPMGFVANDYTLAVWAMGDFNQLISSGELKLDELFDEDMLGDDLDAWLDESSLMKRTFRDCAMIAGLINRRFPGQEKTRRQITISTDLIYDVLRTHEPNHILLEATRIDAATGQLDIKRLGLLLKRIKGQITHISLDHLSPLAIPVMLEIGREPIFGEAHEAILEQAEADLVKEALQ